MPTRRASISNRWASSPATRARTSISRRRDQPQAGEIGSIAAYVAGDQFRPGDKGLRAEKEIRQYPSPNAPRRTVTLVCFARNEQRNAGDRYEDDPRPGEHRFKIFEPLIADGYPGAQALVAGAELITRDVSRY